MKCPKCERETPECAFKGHVFRGVYWCSYCCHRFDEEGRTIVVELEHGCGRTEKVK